MLRCARLAPFGRPQRGRPHCRFRPRSRRYRSSLASRARSASRGRESGHPRRRGGSAYRVTLVAVFLLPLLSPSLFCPKVHAAEEASPFAKAVAAYNDRKLDAALQHAREAVRREPGLVEAHILLGQLYYLRQELDKAEASWKRALELAPTRQDLQQLLAKLSQEKRVEQGLARSDTHPFVVRYASGEIPVDLGELKEILREAHRRVGQSFGYFPDHSITILLYPEQDFLKVRNVSHEVTGLYDGKIRLPILSGRASRLLLESTLWHEYTHAIVHDLSKGRCPMWLNEGLAELQESRIQAPDLRLARAAQAEGKLPAWDQLWSQQGYQPDTIHLNYQVSYWIAKYLVDRFGWSRMVGLLKRFDQGSSMPDALRAEYRADPVVLEKEWRSWLRRRL